MGKVCFIISRIGGDGTPERLIADEKLNHFFKPVLEKLDYESIRADEEETPGSISRSIVERIINSEMVIADISDQNPNVFYEIAIRNAVKKPIIIIRAPDQKPPFDIQDKRAIAIDMSKPDIWRPAMSKLEKQIESAESDSANASESILSDFTFKIEPNTKEDAESVILRNIKDLKEDVRRIAKDVKPTPPISLDIPRIPMIDLAKIRIPNSVQCKSCGVSFLASVKYGTMGGNRSQSEKCLNCGKTNDYSYEDFSDKGL